jgi:putative membrane protein
MKRFVLALGVASFVGGCAHDRWQRVSYYDGCDRCHKVAYRSCDGCNLTSFTGCDGCNRMAYGTVTYGDVDADVHYDERFLPGSPSYAGYNRESEDQGASYRLTASQPQTIDEDFVHDVALGNQTEIELGQLALRNASSPDVKDFAQKLIDGHRQAQSSLENAASSLNIDLPDGLDADHSRMISQLQGVSGTDFDRQFIRMMISDHREDIAAFENRASSPPANQVQNFAIQTLPKLRQHLQTAQELEKRIGG